MSELVDGDKSEEIHLYTPPPGEGYVVTGVYGSRGTTINTKSPYSEVRGSHTDPTPFIPRSKDPVPTESSSSMDDSHKYRPELSKSGLPRKRGKGKR